eukprot:COSAG05_NODE_3344_length_2138_cov_1.961275_1_plen_65_part_00
MGGKDKNGHTKQLEQRDRQAKRGGGYVCFTFHQLLHSLEPFSYKHLRLWTRQAPSTQPLDDHGQ